MGIVIIIGIVQAFFIDLILLSKKNKSLPDKIFAIWMFFIGLHLALLYLQYIEYYNINPHILGISEPLPFIHGPLLLLYVTTLVHIDRKFNKLFLLHFLPAFIYYLLLLPKILLPANEKMRFVFEQIPVDPPLFISIFSILVNVTGPVYIIWSLILLKKHYRNIRESFSDIEKINLIWLRNIIIGMALIWTTILLSYILNDLTLSYLTDIAITLFVFLIGYFGTRQGIIFSDNMFYQNYEKNISANKYEKSPLTDEKAEIQAKQLKEYMEAEKPYLESKITSSHLAADLNTNPNYLSQVINDKIGNNFYDFINKYRV